MRFKVVLSSALVALITPAIALAQSADVSSAVPDSSHSSASNVFAGLILMVIWTGMYFTPGIVATMRKHQSVLAIWACNFFFGWTVVGWIVTLIWALGRAFNNPQNIVVTQVNAPVHAAAGNGADAKLTPQQVAEQIDGLIVLKEKGHLSEEEFVQKKAEVLKRMA